MRSQCFVTTCRSMRHKRGPLCFKLNTQALSPVNSMIELSIIAEMDNETFPCLSNTEILDDKQCFFQRNRQFIQKQNHLQLYEILEYEALYASQVYDAVQCGDIGKVEKFIKSGADINRLYDLHGSYHCCDLWIPFSGRTLLHVALMRKYFNVADFLVKAGAHLNLALHCEAWNYYHTYEKENKKLIISNIQYLLESGADINSTIAGWDKTILFGFSGMPIDENITSILLIAGANVNLHSYDGVTPLSKAVQCRIPNIHTLRLFLLAGAHVNVLSGVHNYNALGIYITEHILINRDVAMLLFAAGEKLDTRTYNDKTNFFAPVCLAPSYLFPDTTALKYKCIEIIREIGRAHV